MIIVRKARLSDVSRMLPLLEEYTRQAEILPRTQDDIYRTIREWVISEADNRIIGMGSLLIMWHDLAEIRSLVVNPGYQGQGVGRGIVIQLIEEAHRLRIPKVFALTRKPDFFLRIGFQPTKIKHLPRKVNRDCVFCSKFHACDEVAVITHLTLQDRLSGSFEPSDPNGTPIIPQTKQSAIHTPYPPGISR
ncbi:N-acetyltransferase [Anaerolineales bacterium HSG24]|nr:N-acetyltransferase [Anaerolineales bacterium HSG24]